jgi:hydrogenase expression/formation protein HypE
LGKLANNELQKMLNCIGKDERVVVPPMIGYDAGVHRLGDKYVVVATDPCMDVPEDWFGWLLINYASSDVALSGANPQFCTVTLLGPRQTKPGKFQKIMKQICQAANKLNIAIVRGHTGIYDSLNDMVGVCTVYGTVEPQSLITAGGAKPGDLLLCTKPLGHETITNYSLKHKQSAQRLFGARKQQKLGRQVPMQSCVKEALELAGIEGVNAMHDATEGGFVSALNEIAEASDVGLSITWEAIPIPPEVLSLKKHFGLTNKQVLSMSSTGTILASVEPESRQKVTEALKNLGLTASWIGEFTKNKERTLTKSNKARVFPNQPDDRYAMILAKSTS